MPTFPNLNGQIKVPLRFYSDERLTSWNALACKATFAACPYTIVTPQDALPPFQFWKDPSTATITSWEVYDTAGGGPLADLTSDAGLIEQVELSDVDYWVYSGTALDTPLPTADPNVGLYCRIEFSDGTTYWSELFRTTCETPSDSSPVFEWDFDEDGPLIGWGVGSSGNEADDTYSAGDGDPIIIDPPNGWVVINTVDFNVYTYDEITDTWSSEAPAPDDYRLVASTGTWLVFSGGVWIEMVSPPFTVSGSGVCYIAGNNSDDLGLVYDGIDYGTGPWTVIVEVGSISAGSVDLIIGDVTQALSVGTNEVTVENIADDTINFAITGFTGCILSVRVSRADADLLCNLKLEWTNCGNVGNIYYEDGFTNTLFLDRGAEVIRPTIAIVTDNTENGRKDQIQDFFRKEVEYRIPLGDVPWHIADAISEIPGHDTVTLTLKYGQGSVTMTRIRVVQTWPEGNNTNDCYQRLDLFFQVDEATVSTACCDTFDRPCDQELDPGEITDIDCFEGDCDLGVVITADIPAGYFGQLLLTINGTDWFEGDLDLSSEEWATNEIPVQTEGAFSFSIRVYSGDCEIGVTTPTALPCDVGVAYRFDTGTTDADPGSGEVRFNNALAASTTFIFISDFDGNGVDRSAVWLGAFGQIALEFRDIDDEVLFDVVSTTNATNYVKIEVTHSAGNAPSNHQALCVSIRDGG